MHDGRVKAWEDPIAELAVAMGFVYDEEKAHGALYDTDLMMQDLVLHWQRPEMTTDFSPYRLTPTTIKAASPAAFSMPQNKLFTCLISLLCLLSHVKNKLHRNDYHKGKTHERYKFN